MHYNYFEFYCVFTTKMAFVLCSQKKEEISKKRVGYLLLNKPLLTENQ